MRELHSSEAALVSGQHQTIPAQQACAELAPDSALKSSLKQKPTQRPRALQRPGWLHRVFGLKPDRREALHRPCHVEGALVLRESGATLKGAVMGIHVNGVLFRQGVSYLVDRSGAIVTVQFAGYELLGKIMDVSESGYSVEFFKSLSALDVEALLSAQAPLPLNSL
jgi:hypothetical protein